MPFRTGLVPAIVLAAGAISFAGSGVRADPSFDCSRASAPDEVAICSDPQLAKLDSLIAGGYRDFVGTFQPKQEVGRQLLQDRQSCGGDKVCIAAVQSAALDTFSVDVPDAAEAFISAGMAEKAKRAAVELTAFAKQVPSKPAECVKTRISGIYRENPEPMTSSNAAIGISSAGYENGGAAYAADAGLLGAQVGQPVVQCLISRRYDCPAGDDRGKVFYTLDLVTKRSWIAPDSEHSCGGA